MSADTTQLQAEVQRLNVIIAVLVEKNQQLERELSLLKAKHPVYNTQIYSDAGAPSYLPVVNADLQSDTSYLTPVAAAISNENTCLQPVDRMTINDTSYLTRSDIPNAAIDGMKKEGMILSQKSDRNKVHVLNPELSEDRQELASLAARTNPNSIYWALKEEEMIHTTNSGVYNVAKALHLLCTEPRCSYARLGSQLHLSVSGVGKMVSALLRRGLVVRQQRQVFRFTEKTMLLLERATQI